MGVLAGEVVSVLAHVQGADEDRSGRGEPLDQERVPRGRRPLAVDLRSCPGRKPCDVEQVFCRKGHAGERSQGIPARTGQRSTARAWRRARSAVTSVNALMLAVQRRRSAAGRCAPPLRAVTVARPDAFGDRDGPAANGSTVMARAIRRSRAEISARARGVVRSSGTAKT